MHIAFVQGIGPTELIIVLVIVLLIFGPKRLPSLARSVGSGMREFKDSLSGGDKEPDRAPDPSPAARVALEPSSGSGSGSAAAASEPVATERS